MQGYPSKTEEKKSSGFDFAIMRRFLPYLWPKDRVDLRVRIVFALLLVLVSKLVQFSMGWLYGKAIDKMVPGAEAGYQIAIALVAAYAGARFGGVMAMTPEWGDMPSHWSIYIPVPDVDACLARAVELGGKVCVPAFNVPGVGRIARLNDPAGAGVYVITLGSKS